VGVCVCVCVSVCAHVRVCTDLFLYKWGRRNECVRECVSANVCIREQSRESAGGREGKRSGRKRDRVEIGRAAANGAWRRAHERECKSLGNCGSRKSGEQGSVTQEGTRMGVACTESEAAEGKYECEPNRKTGQHVPRGHEPLWCLICTGQK